MSKFSKWTYPGHRSAVSNTFVFHFSPPKAENRNRYGWRYYDRKEKNHTDCNTCLVLTLKTLNNPLQSFHSTLTFVKACRHIASRRAQQNPEDHSTGHESPSVGRWQETQAGQDYSGQIINALIQTCSISTYCSFNTPFYATPVCDTVKTKIGLIMYALLHLSSWFIM